ncbi:MAG TPA: hypothetical protein VMF61_08650 [Candidatus Acidoferrales bacterium]|nr:hypothetical protein [Candidatus Acidoferrales bacterium]
MSQSHEEHGAGEAPLTGTLRFVFVMGVAFALGWLGMFLLLKDRW